jgi:hypothetical protein
VTLIQDDPTWIAEYAHFCKLVAERATTDLSNDRWLHRVLGKLSADAATLGKR